LTQACAAPSLTSTEVHLNPDLEAKLMRLATEQGRETSALQKAVERSVDDE
jgi:hypothetical protein